MKIDLCAEKLPLTNCVSLARKAEGREAKVRIPFDYPLGKALLVVRERGAKGALTGKAQFHRPLLVVQGALPPPSPESVAKAPGGGSPTIPSVSGIRVRALSHGPGSGTYSLIINFETNVPVCEEVSSRVEVSGQWTPTQHHYSQEAGPPHCPGTEPHQSHSTGTEGTPAGQNVELRFVYRPGSNVSGIWIPTADPVVIAGPFRFQMPTDDQGRTWEF